jgi:hypothetical protein
VQVGLLGQEREQGVGAQMVGKLAASNVSDGGIARQCACKHVCVGAVGVMHRCMCIAHGNPQTQLGILCR